jgi:glycosyltransferase involved in cell wall biosynthesis
MKVLQIAPQVPYPPDDGGKVGIFNITKHLAGRGHEITMFAFGRPPGDEYRPLREYCDLHTVEHPTGNNPVDALLNIFSDLPYTISKYRSPELMNRLADYVQQHRPDVVHVDHLHMAEYGIALRERFGIPAVLREHNVECVIMERFADHARNPLLKVYARMQQRRLHRYESAAVGGFDACCPITPDDSEKLRGMNSTVPLRIVPGGVEESYFTPRGQTAPTPGSIVFFGGLGWPPNRDAVRWFIDEIFPIILRQVPVSTFTIIGKNIPDDLARRAGPRCVIRGYVEDLRAEIQRHAVSVAPYRIGGGMRLKIIESFAMRVPVVSTTVGCEGIGAVEGEHLLVGDSPEAFASQVVSVLSSPSASDALRERAFSLARDRYRWEHVAAELEGVYREVVAGGSRG